VPVPCDGVGQREGTAPTFKVDGVWCRKPLDVIKRALSEPSAELFHLAPFRSYWNTPDGTKERLFGETYTADVFLEEYEKICEARREKGDTATETVVIGLSLSSDSTHLTSFGNAALHPVYLYLTNQTKYNRASPSALAAHHLAYLPKVLWLSWFQS